MGPSPDQIRAQADRLLASNGFANTDRLSRFLRYIVERSIAGEAGQLKEYVIGREVFDRNEDFDPRLDSIVRVEAGRLRAKIDEYYNGAGRNDDVIIQLRRGGYAPTFGFRARSSDGDQVEPARTARRDSSARRWRLGLGVVGALFAVGAVVVWRSGIWATAERPAPTATIAVLPFASYSADQSEQLLAARVTDGVTGELARLGTLGVVSHTSALQFGSVRRPLRDIAKALDAALILEGTVRQDGGQLTVQVRLVDAARDQKFWVEDFAGPVTDAVEVQRRIAAATSDAATKRRTR